MNVSDATIPMHPHETEERRFVCYCGAAHTWGEKGTMTFIIPRKRHDGLGWMMIQCPCKTWHMKAIVRQDAENLIREEA